jgi:hypothetical protein
MDPLEIDKSKQISRRLYHHVFARAGNRPDPPGAVKRLSRSPK